MNKHVGSWVFASTIFTAGCGSVSQADEDYEPYSEVSPDNQEVSVAGKKWWERLCGASETATSRPALSYWQHYRDSLSPLTDEYRKASDAIIRKGEALDFIESQVGTRKNSVCLDAARSLRDLSQRFQDILISAEGAIVQTAGTERGSVYAEFRGDVQLTVTYCKTLETNLLSYCKILMAKAPTPTRGLANSTSDEQRMSEISLVQIEDDYQRSPTLPSRSVSNVQAYMTPVLSTRGVNGTAGNFLGTPGRRRVRVLTLDEPAAVGGEGATTKPDNAVVNTALTRIFRTPTTMSRRLDDDEELQDVTYSSLLAEQVAELFKSSRATGDVAIHIPPFDYGKPTD